MFGCHAFAKVLGYTKKFYIRCKKLTFIDYTFNGYGLWDKQQWKILVHGDVVFQTKREDNKIC